MRYYAKRRDSDLIRLAGVKGIKRGGKEVPGNFIADNREVTVLANI